MTNTVKKLIGFLKKIESLKVIKAIRQGFIMIIPAIMLGAACLVLQYLPIPAYQSFVNAALDGNIIKFLQLMYDCTFNMLSVLLTVSVSVSYSRQLGCKNQLLQAITSLVCFFAFSGIIVSDSSWEALGVKGVFLALVTSVAVTKLHIVMTEWMDKKGRSYNYLSEASFNRSVSSIPVTFIIVAAAAAVNIVVFDIFEVHSFFELITEFTYAVFSKLGNSFFGALCVTASISILWFFGIHGSDALEPIMSKIFTPAINVNIDLVSRHLPPTEIFTKQFFDMFILIGGCGTSIALLLAILIFSRNRNSRRLSKMAILPMLFNINELMTFGLPIIFNAIFFIPFVLTPIVSLIIAYIAVKTGIVPMTISEVNWTTPAILSGYLATGSVRGSILQIVNIAVGVFIYRPFVLIYDKKCEDDEMEQYESLIDILKKSEENLVPVTLTELPGDNGILARSLVKDLRNAIRSGELKMYYQPQYNNNDICVGMEALIRWKHLRFGMMYPPLIIKLAFEGGFLPTLEQDIIRWVIKDEERIYSETGFDGKISINVTSESIYSDDYMSFLHKLKDERRVDRYHICLEVTEQTTLQSDEYTYERLKRIKDMGYTLAIDDFAMGHTSLKYLQSNYFDIVKLDGSLIKGMFTDAQSTHIITSVVNLSKTLNFDVVAEFVETKEQMKKLEEIGCNCYQGYLYSPALSPDELIEKLLSDRRYLKDKSVLEK